MSKIVSCCSWSVPSASECRVLAKSLPNIIEKASDLFTHFPAYSLAHCVAADLCMYRGIAAEFLSRFGGRHLLLSQNRRVGEVAVLVKNDTPIFYMITKEKSYGKPTMASLRQSLMFLKSDCTDRGVTKLAIPKIGCGLDRLHWQEVHISISRHHNPSVMIFRRRINLRQLEEY